LFIKSALRQDIAIGERFPHSAEHLQCE